jgi:hypothetical protein
MNQDRSKYFTSRSRVMNVSTREFVHDPRANLYIDNITRYKNRITNYTNIRLFFFFWAVFKKTVPSRSRFRISVWHFLHRVQMSKVMLASKCIDPQRRMTHRFVAQCEYQLCPVLLGAMTGRHPKR